MSQTMCGAFYKNSPVNVIAGVSTNIRNNGWFCIVEALEEDNPDADEASCIYSNLSDLNLQNSFGLSDSLDYFKNKLKELNIVVEEGFFQRVEVEGN